MKVRQIKKRFWWTWRFWPMPYDGNKKVVGWFDWGVGRIKHQIKDAS